MARILITEDNKELRDIMVFYLKKENHEITAVESAEEALTAADNELFDVMLLDIMLPGEDGITLCRKLRKNNFCPIIFVSCLNDDATIVKALDIGGDDYITKPFSGAVLNAKVNSQLRRNSGNYSNQRDNITVGKLTLNRKTHMLLKDEEEIVLSPTEYDILDYLMSRKGEFVSSESIYAEVWHCQSLGDKRSLFVHIRHLRQKIEDDPQQPYYIRTHPQKGYIFAAK